MRSRGPAAQRSPPRLRDGGRDEGRCRRRAVQCGAAPQLEARRLLEALDEVVAVTAFGDRLHVTAREGAALETLVAALRDDGIDVAFAEPIEPGLEDAFTAAIRQEDAHVG